MQNIIRFLSLHGEIDELLILVGEETSSTLLYDCCKINNYKKITVSCKSKRQIEEFKKTLNLLQVLNNESYCANIDVVEHCAIHYFRFSYINTAILFDSLHLEEELSIVNLLRARYLVGKMRKNEISSFRLWERCRNNISCFYLVSLGDENREEIMHLEYREDNDIELTVVFPVYNVGRYIEQCIQSIKEWEAEYVEYLFIDDGSLDESAEIIKKYTVLDKRIKLFRKKNGGCASARQFGVEHARGRYIGFVDPDDYIDPTMFKKLLERAMVGSYEVSYCGYRELHENTGVIKEVDDLLGHPYRDGTYDRVEIQKLMAFLRIAIWRGIYSKKLLERGKIYFYTDLRRFDDLPFKVEVFAKAMSVVCVPEYLYYYRLDREGQDVLINDERLFTHFEIFKHLDNSLGRGGSFDEVEYLQIVKIATHRWALEKIKPEYYRTYIKRAQADLLKNVTAAESRRIVKKYCDRKSQLYNLAICYNLPILIETN